MVIANLSDGTTRSFDIAEGEQHHALLDLLSQGSVTALSILHHGTQHSLPRPRRFRRQPVYAVEQLLNGGNAVVGERISAQADDVRVSITATYSSKLVRSDLVRIGHMKYNRLERGNR